MQSADLMQSADQKGETNAKCRSKGLKHLNQVRTIIPSSKLGEQGWRSSESARLPPMCPGFDSRTRRHMWAEFVGSLLCSERFFSGNSGFPLSTKINI